MSLFYQVNFNLFGLIAVASALLFVTRKSPVAAALWLVNTMFALAALYIMLDAQFVGVVQLLNLVHATEGGDFRDKKIRFGAGALALLLLAELLVLTRGTLPEVAPS